MKSIRPAWRSGRFQKILRRLPSVAPWRRRVPSFYGIPLLLASALVLFSATDSDRAVLGSDTDAYEAYALFFGLNPTNLAAEAYLCFDGDNLNNWQEFELLTDPFSSDTDFDGITDNFDIVNPISRFYIQWGSPWFTEGDYYDYAHPDYFLGAWKDGGEWFSTFVKPEAGRIVRNTAELSTQSGWHAASVESNVVESLNVALDRGILTNNLVYALHYWNRDSSRASLFVDLLATNGSVVAENLYGNLMDGTNEEAVVLLAVPTASFSNAAVIQLRRGMGEVVVYEGLVYIDEDADGLDGDAERQLGTSDYCVDTDGDGTNDYDACFRTTNTNNPVPVPIEPDIDDGGDDENDNNAGIIYVDQALGNDTFTGRALDVAGQDGPKKTVRKGMAAVDADGAHTLIIKSGAYNENLDLRGKNVKVVIEGNVRL